LPGPACQRRDASAPAQATRVCRFFRVFAFPFLSGTMMRSFLLTCALVGVASEALELTPDNFDAEVLQSGKAAFIKFLAPW